MVTDAELRADLRSRRFLAIVRGEGLTPTVKAVMALIESGVRCLEVSLTGAEASAALAELLKERPAGVLIGAGTVLTRDECRSVYDIGVDFVVTPGQCPGLAAAAELGLPTLAGALTPSEIIDVSARATAVKLFPASLGGPDYVSALRAPFPSVDFVPVGGIDLDAARAFLAAGAMAVGIGGPLVGEAAVSGEVTELRRRASTMVNELSA